MGLYRVGRDVEDSPYLSIPALAVEKAQHGQLALGKLLCVRSRLPLPPAQLTLPAAAGAREGLKTCQLRDTFL